MSDKADEEVKNEPDRKFLEFLVCPVTRMPLDYNHKKQELISRAAWLAYPIRNGSPIMCIDEARKLEDEEE